MTHQMRGLTPSPPHRLSTGAVVCRCLKHWLMFMDTWLGHNRTDKLRLKHPDWSSQLDADNQSQSPIWSTSLSLSLSLSLSPAIPAMTYTPARNIRPIAKCEHGWCIASQLHTIHPLFRSCIQPGIHNFMHTDAYRIIRYSIGSL
jgi:hypothetical protein